MRYAFMPSRRCYAAAMPLPSIIHCRCGLRCFRTPDLSPRRFAAARHDGDSFACHQRLISLLPLIFDFRYACHACHAAY